MGRRARQSFGAENHSGVGSFVGAGPQTRQLNQQSHPPLPAGETNFHNVAQLNKKQVMKQTTMQLGMIGLGRMGANMVRRLLKNGHKCVVFDRSPKSVDDLVKEGAQGAGSLAELVKKLSKPRAIW